MLILFCSNITLGDGYHSYHWSPDGSDVACGGEYLSCHWSPDGSKVCAGGDIESRD